MKLYVNDYPAIFIEDIFPDANCPTSKFCITVCNNKIYKLKFLNGILILLRPFITSKNSNADFSEFVISQIEDSGEYLFMNKYEHDIKLFGQRTVYVLDLYNYCKYEVDSLTD